MRILFLNPSGQLGGAELSLLDVIASLRSQYPDWKLGLIASAPGPLLERASAHDVEVNVLPFPARLASLGDASPDGSAPSATWKLVRSTLQAFTYKRQLARMVRVFSPDVLHTNGFKMHVLGTLARCGRPVLWHVRDFVSNRSIMVRLLRQLASKHISVVANSDAVADDVRNVLKDSVRVTTVRNAIDLNQFSPDGPVVNLDQLSGLPPAAPGVVRVGLLATLAFWKGHETFLRAIALLPRAMNVRAYVIGDRIYETSTAQYSLDELRSMATTLGIADSVGFTGYIADSATAIRALDIVVHASTRPEPFGRVIAEAMACERAVITSGQGGAAEIVSPECDALTFIAGNAESLAKAIQRLVSDSGFRQKLAHAGLQRAHASFDRQRLAAELAPIYLRICEHTEP